MNINKKVKMQLDYLEEEITDKLEYEEEGYYEIESLLCVYEDLLILKGKVTTYVKEEYDYLCGDLSISLLITDEDDEILVDLNKKYEIGSFIERNIGIVEIDVEFSKEFKDYVLDIANILKHYSKKHYEEGLAKIKEEKDEIIKQIEQIEI